MRDWLVAGAVVLGPGGVLLVQNRRRDGAVDWSPPGGVIDPGETLIEGLTREVREETGLTVVEWRGPLYEVVAEAPSMGWRLRVEAHLAVAYEGELRVDDPDGIVVDARFAACEGCEGLLDRAPQWVREPLQSWLAERHPVAPTFAYRVDGSDRPSLAVTRLG